MKHITYADKSFLIGDEAADLVLEYAAALTRAGTGDTVELDAYGADGDEVKVTLLLDPGTSIIAETTTSTFEEPDNAAEVARMREQIAATESPTAALPFEESAAEKFDEAFEDEFRTE